VNERRFGAELPRGFQQIQRAHGIGVEIIEWNVGGASWLGCAAV